MNNNVRCSVVLNDVLFEGNDLVTTVLATKCLEKFKYIDLGEIRHQVGSSVFT
jgi:hypothetical protein